MHMNSLKNLPTVIRGLLTLMTSGAFYFAGTRNQGFQNGPTLCFFNNITGFPCPTCGLTRSVFSLANGEFVQSLRFNPLGVVVVGLISLWALDRLKIPEPLKFGAAKLIEKRQFAIVAVSLILFWGFNFVRVVTGIYPN